MKLLLWLFLAAFCWPLTLAVAVGWSLWICASWALTLLVGLATLAFRGKPNSRVTRGHLRLQTNNRGAHKGRVF